MPLSGKDKRLVEENKERAFYKKILAPNKTRKAAIRRGSESPKHFLSKAVIYYLLESAGHEAYTEVKNAKGDVYDALDATTRIVYEVQGDMEVDKSGQYQEDYINDIIVFPLSEIPETLSEMLKYFKDRLVL